MCVCIIYTLIYICIHMHTYKHAQNAHRVKIQGCFYNIHNNYIATCVCIVK